MVSHSFTDGAGFFGTVTILGATITIISKNGMNVDVLSAPVDMDGYLVATHIWTRLHDVDHSDITAGNLVDLVGAFLTDIEPDVAQAVERFVLSWIIKGPVKQ